METVAEREPLWVAENGFTGRYIDKAEIERYYQDGIRISLKQAQERGIDKLEPSERLSKSQRRTLNRQVAVADGKPIPDDVEAVVEKPDPSATLLANKMREEGGSLGAFLADRTNYPGEEGRMRLEQDLRKLGADVPPGADYGTMEKKVAALASVSGLSKADAFTRDLHELSGEQRRYLVSSAIVRGSPSEVARLLTPMSDEELAVLMPGTKKDNYLIARDKLVEDARKKLLADRPPTLKELAFSLQLQSEFEEGRKKSMYTPKDVDPVEAGTRLAGVKNAIARTFGISKMSQEDTDAVAGAVASIQNLTPIKSTQEQRTDDVTTPLDRLLQKQEDEDEKHPWMIERPERAVMRQVRKAVQYIKDRRAEAENYARDAGHTLSDPNEWKKMPDLKRSEDEWLDKVSAEMLAFGVDKPTQGNNIRAVAKLIGETRPEGVDGEDMPYGGKRWKYADYSFFSKALAVVRDNLPKSWGGVQEILGTYINRFQFDRNVIGGIQQFQAHVGPGEISDKIDSYIEKKTYYAPPKAPDVKVTAADAQIRTHAGIDSNVETVKDLLAASAFSRGLEIEFVAGSNKGDAANTRVVRSGEIKEDGDAKVKVVMPRHQSSGDAFAAEAGYALERNSRKLREACAKFAQGRCDTEPFTDLSERYPDGPYTAGDVGRKDQFDKGMDEDMAWRAGTVKLGKNGEIEQTGILAMGLAAMARDPQRFAREDPSYAAFVVSAMSGKTEVNSSSSSNLDEESFVDSEGNVVTRTRKAKRTRRLRTSPPSITAKLLRKGVGMYTAAAPAYVAGKAFGLVWSVIRAMTRVLKGG